MIFRKYMCNIFIAFSFSLSLFGCQRSAVELEVTSENLIFIGNSYKQDDAAVILYTEAGTNNSVEWRIGEKIKDWVGVEGEMLFWLNNVCISGNSVYYEVAIQRKYGDRIDRQEFSYSGLISIPDGQVTPISFAYKKLSANVPSLSYDKLLGIFRGCAYFQQIKNELLTIYSFQNNTLVAMSEYTDRAKPIRIPVDFLNMVYFDHEVVRTYSSTSSRLWMLHGPLQYNVNIKSVFDDAILYSVYGEVSSDVYYPDEYTSRVYFVNGLALMRLECINRVYELSNIRILNLPSYNSDEILQLQLFELENNNILLKLTKTIWSRNVFSRFIFDSADDIYYYFLARYTDDQTLEVIEQLKYFPFNTKTSILQIAPNTEL